MRLLLDTNVVIWLDVGVRVPADIVSMIRTADEVYVSAASAWEIAIEISLGKFTTTRTVEQAAHDSGFVELPVRFRHMAHVASLPLHHRDPFDRLLIAQALVESLTIVTHDPRFSRYDVPILRV